MVELAFVVVVVAAGYCSRLIDHIAQLGLAVLASCFVAVVVVAAAGPFVGEFSVRYITMDFLSYLAACVSYSSAYPCVVASVHNHP